MHDAFRYSTCAGIEFALAANPMNSNSLKVWAPLAKNVWLHTGQQKLALERCTEHALCGDWIVPAGYELWSQDEHADYRLSIDDGPARPDPRSAWQPHGYDGPSRQLDHQQFQWTDNGFQSRPLSSAIIYEMHVGTFTPEGTFAAAIERLDHLVQLGITHIELMPVSEFPGEFGWGYDGVGLFAPHHRYGGPQGLKQLVDACHARSLAVILDVVYNHLGPVGNYLREFGPYFSEQHKTPWGAAINFDGPHSDGVRRFFCDNAMMWLQDYHVDALRLDAVHAIVDTTSVPFLEQLAVEVEKLSAHLGRHLSLIAESDLNDPRLLRSREAGGFGLSAQWCDDFHHALHTAITGERDGYYQDFGNLSGLASAFIHPYIYTGQHSSARERRHGRPAHFLTGHRFITFAQNHDQIGNRAGGERLGQLVGHAQAKLAAALLMFSPHIPQLFQGEELHCQQPFLYFADWRDHPQLAEAVRQGRNEEFAAFGWTADQLADPTEPDSFERSKIRWIEPLSDHSRDMFEWYRTLISLRKQFPDLTDGNFDAVQTWYSDEEQWLCVQRGRLWLLCNFKNVAQKLTLPRALPSHWRVLLRSDQDNSNNAAAKAESSIPNSSNLMSSSDSITLPAHSAIILESQASCPS